VGDNYDPTGKEILGEMVEDGFGTRLKEVVLTAITVSTIPYILPTVIREWNELKPINNQYGSDFTGNTAYDVGVVCGMFLDVAQLAAYAYAQTEGSNLWLIPVVTNVLSGIYEARRRYNNTRERILDRYNSGDLETTVQEIEEQD